MSMPRRELELEPTVIVCKHLDGYLITDKADDEKPIYGAFEKGDDEEDNDSDSDEDEE